MLSAADILHIALYIVLFFKPLKHPHFVQICLCYWSLKSLSIKKHDKSTLLVPKMISVSLNTHNSSKCKEREPEKNVDLE